MEGKGLHFRRMFFFYGLAGGGLLCKLHFELAGLLTPLSCRTCISELVVGRRSKAVLVGRGLHFRGKLCFLPAVGRHGGPSVGVRRRKASVRRGLHVRGKLCCFLPAGLLSRLGVRSLVFLERKSPAVFQFLQHALLLLMLLLLLLLLYRTYCKTIMIVIYTGLVHQFRTKHHRRSTRLRHHLCSCCCFCCALGHVDVDGKAEATAVGKYTRF